MQQLKNSYFLRAGSETLDWIRCCLFQSLLHMHTMHTHLEAIQHNSMILEGGRKTENPEETCEEAAEITVTVTQG